MGNSTSSHASQPPAAPAPIETAPVLGYKEIIIVRRARIETFGEIIFETINYRPSPREIFKGHIIYGLLYLSLINACLLEQKECVAFANYASSLQRHSTEWMDLTIVMDGQLATSEMLAEFGRKWMRHYAGFCLRRKQLLARADWHAGLGLNAIQVNRNGKRLRDESESDNENNTKKTRTLPPPAVRPPTGYYVNRFGIEVRITVPAELNPLSTYKAPKDTHYPLNEPAESKSEFIQAWAMAHFRNRRRLGRERWHEMRLERKRVPSPLKHEVEADEAPVYQFTFRVPSIRSVSMADLNLDFTRRVTRFSSRTSLRLKLPNWLFGKSAA
ncbi:hypothetical protein BDZ89DRAFT_1078613 [Hymenopellis radicata]|nr:hypothetical protein BDZ89DRAFT_1078613 [Hymenopellis radicata]